MRALVQRVSSASVTVNTEVLGEINAGLVILIGISKDDTRNEANHIIGRIVNLRIFSGEEGKFENSALDVRADLLVISQFTLYGNTRKGRRPSFTEAARPEQAKELFEMTLELFRETGLKVETGEFQKHMVVSIKNDGPVTIMLDSSDKKPSHTDE